MSKLTTALVILTLVAGVSADPRALDVSAGYALQKTSIRNAISLASTPREALHRFDLAEMRYGDDAGMKRALVHAMAGFGEIEQAADAARALVAAGEADSLTWAVTAELAARTGDPVSAAWACYESARQMPDQALRRVSDSRQADENLFVFRTVALVAAWYENLVAEGSQPIDSPITRQLRSAVVILAGRPEFQQQITSARDIYANPPQAIAESLNEANDARQAEPSYGRIVPFEDDIVISRYNSKIYRHPYGDWYYGGLYWRSSFWRPYYYCRYPRSPWDRRGHGHHHDGHKPDDTGFRFYGSWTNLGNGRTVTGGVIVKNPYIRFDDRGKLVHIEPEPDETASPTPYLGPRHRAGVEFNRRGGSEPASASASSDAVRRSETRLEGTITSGAVVSTYRPGPSVAIAKTVRPAVATTYTKPAAYVPPNVAAGTKAAPARRFGATAPQTGAILFNRTPGSPSGRFDVGDDEEQESR